MDGPGLQISTTVICSFPPRQYFDDSYKIITLQFMPIQTREMLLSIFFIPSYVYLEKISFPSGVKINPDHSVKSWQYLRVHFSLFV